MNPITCIDDAVNFMPKTPAKKILEIGYGTGADGLMAIPVAASVYMSLCAMQGGAVGAGIYHFTNNIPQSMVGAAVTTMIPPATLVTRALYTALVADKDH